MKEPIFINKAKVKNPEKDFIGVLKEFKPAGDGREIPVIKSAFLQAKSVLTSPFRSGEKELDYLKVKEEDKIRYSVGAFDIIEIRNNSNIPGVHEDDELLVSDTSERIKEFNREKDELKREVKKLRKENKRLMDEQEEKDKAKSDRRKKVSLECAECGMTNPRSFWENNRGRCPECRRGLIDEAIKV